MADLFSLIAIIWATWSSARASIVFFVLCMASRHKEVDSVERQAAYSVGRDVRIC